MQTGVLKATLAIAGIFIAGAVAGGFGGVAWEKDRATRDARRISAQSVADKHMKGLIRDLELTAEQEKCIRPIMLEFADELRAARRKAWAEVADVLHRINLRIETELTPHQLEKFREIQDRQRRQREEEQARRSPHPQNAESEKPAAPQLEAPPTPALPQ